MSNNISLVIARSEATKPSIVGRHRKMDGRVASLLAMTMTGIAALPASARADATEDFYKGRTLNMIIGLGEGGGYDFSARLVAQHLGDFLPGKPTIVPRNMPGAGSIAAAEHVYNIAPKDGATIALVQPTFVLEKITDKARKQWIAIHYQS